MKKLISFLTVLSFFIFINGAGTKAYAQTEEIESEAFAKELAAKADGVYVKGADMPAVRDTETALPIVDETSGEIIGYIVADRNKLVAALNEAGLTEVAEALAAAEAGTAAGQEVNAGLSGGTITLIALVVAGAVGAALALGGGGGGGGDGGGTTPPPAH